jgi:hypothetical protein
MAADPGQVAGRLGRYACLRRDEFTDQRRHRISCCAVALDLEVVRIVAAGLSPASVGAALEVIGNHRSGLETARRTRRHEFTRVQDEIDQRKQQLLLLSPDRHMLRNELETELETLLLRRGEVERELAREDAAKPMLSPVDADELVALTADFWALWNASTTGDADRKRLLRTVLTRVTLSAPTDGSVDEKLDVEIAWVGGHRDRTTVLRPKGVVKLMVARRRQGVSVKEITAEFAAAGIQTIRGRPFSRKTLQHRLWDGGFNTKDDRLAALRLIREMLIARHTRREILERLRSGGPPPKEGEWTLGRLGTAITSLKQRRWATDVAPLPPEVTVVRRLPVEVIGVIRSARAERPPRRFEDIAADLNALGHRTPRDRRFTMMNLYQLYQQLCVDGDLGEDSGVQSRPDGNVDDPDSSNTVGASPRPRPRGPRLSGVEAAALPQGSSA